MSDPAYDRDAEVIQVDELPHPRDHKRSLIGLHLDHKLPTVPQLLRELDHLHKQDRLNAGGAHASTLDRSSAGADDDDPTVRAVLARSREPEDEAAHWLHVELLRLRREYAIKVKGQAFAGSLNRDAQRERIKRYPKRWTNADIAAVEGCSEPWVRLVRGSARKKLSPATVG